MNEYICITLQDIVLHELLYIYIYMQTYMTRPKSEEGKKRSREKGESKIAS